MFPMEMTSQEEVSASAVSRKGRTGEILFQLL